MTPKVPPAQLHCTILVPSNFVGVNSIVLIGPEGDFTQEELEVAMAAGYKKVSLGNSRLRTETAGLVACHTLNLINQ